jgi:hypothetical protein
MEFTFEITDDEGYDLELMITVNGLDVEEIHDSYDGHWVTGYNVSYDSIEATLDGEPYKLTDKIERNIAREINELAVDWASS